MNFATIGTSSITEKFIKAARESERLTLKAVYSRNLDKCTRFANQYGVKLVFNDLEELAQCNEIDTVYIASPNSLHYEQTILMLEHGKHVICEKPIFSNLAEFRRAYEIAEKHGVFLIEAMRTIHTPNFQLLMNNMKRVGKVRNVSLQFMKYSSRYDQYLEGDIPNIFSPEYSGGALVDLGVYPLYIAVTLFGKPRSFGYYPVMLDNGVDGGGTLVLQYGEFVCTIMCSKITNSYGNNEIHGEDGNIVFTGTGQIQKLEFIDRSTKICEPFSIQHAKNDLIYEIEKFVQIMESENREEYQKLVKLSETVLEITEQSRKQNRIIYGKEAQ